MFLASQNTMCALIGGLTLHSFNKLVYKQNDGKTISNQAGQKNDVSKHFLIYQSLRFMIIDEASTASLEILAEIDHYTSTHIRKRNTWAQRSKRNERLFGGLNIGFA